jgi:hypothetical protein
MSEEEPKTLIQLTDSGYNPFKVWWHILIKPVVGPLVPAAQASAHQSALLLSRFAGWLEHITAR